MSDNNGYATSHQHALPKGKTVKIPTATKPHLHFYRGHWCLEPALKGDGGVNWEQAYFWRQRMNNDINNERCRPK